MAVLFRTEAPALHMLSMFATDIDAALASEQQLTPPAPAARLKPPPPMAHPQAMQLASAVARNHEPAVQGLWRTAPFQEVPLQPLDDFRVRGTAGRKKGDMHCTHVV